MGPSETKTMFLEPATLIEVHNLINDLENKTTLDTKISVLRAANISKNVSAAFTKDINSLFEQGIFPDSLKTAKVEPIYKDGPKTAVANYCSISVIDCILENLWKTYAP